MRFQAITAFGAPLQAMERETPVPTGTQVLLKVHNCGVCHSDVHIHDGYFDLGGEQRLPMANLPLPHTLGHEIQGEVEAVGPAAQGVSVGERYTAYPWIGEGSCPACQRGEEHLCATPRQLGCSVDGGYATHVLVPHPRYLLDFGTCDPALAATYMCSGLTAYAAMRKVGRPGPEDEVLVLGCGGVGMMGVQFAQALFGKAPLAADIDPARLEAARAAGAKAVYNSRDEDAAERLMADTNGGCFAVVDFVGAQPTFAFAHSVIRRGGRIVLVGLFGGAMAMPLPLFPLRQLSIVGSFVGSLAEARDMMALVREGRIAPIPIEKRPLEDANAALEDLRAGSIVGRAVLQP